MADHRPVKWCSLKWCPDGARAAGAFFAILSVSLAAAPGAYAGVTRPSSPTQPTVSTTTTTTSPLQPEQPVIDRSGDQPIVPHNDKADLYVTFPPSAPAFRHELLLMQSLQTVLKSEGYMTTLYYNTKEGTANDGTATAQNFISMAKASVIVFNTHGFNYYLPHKCKNESKGLFRIVTGHEPAPTATTAEPITCPVYNGGPSTPAAILLQWYPGTITEALARYAQFIKGGYSPNYFFLGDTRDDYGRDAYGLAITEAGIAHYFGQSQIDLIDALACHSLTFAPDFNAVSFYGYIPVSCGKDSLVDTRLLWSRLIGEEGVDARTTTEAETLGGFREDLLLADGSGPVVLSPAVTGISPSSGSGLVGSSTPGTVTFDAKMDTSDPENVVSASGCGASITDAQWDDDGTALDFDITTPANQASSGSVTLTVHNAVAQGAPGGSDNDKLDGNQNQGKSGLEPNRNDYTWKVSCGSSGFHLSGNVTTTLSLDSTATCNNDFTPRDVMLFMTPTGHPYTPPQEDSGLDISVAQSGTTTFPTSSGAASLGYFPNGSVPDAYGWGDLVPGQADTTGTVTLKGNGSSGSVDLTVPALIKFGKQGQATASETIVGSWDCNKK
jgi:hypothetical protein